MSHEIRTPMNAIIGSRIWRSRPSSRPSSAITSARVHNAGTSLLAIINDILDFSKIEAGVTPKPRTLNWTEVISRPSPRSTAQKAHEKRLGNFGARRAGYSRSALLGDPLRLGHSRTSANNASVH